MSTGLIIALDDPDLDKSVAMARELSGKASAFKVGLTLFAAYGPEAIARIADHGRVFCDLKLHDIPHQIDRATSELCRMGVWMLTVHSSGGLPMMEAAVKAARANHPEPLVAAVTVLTSLSSDQLALVGQGDKVKEQVIRLARVAMDAGVPALVSSARYLQDLRAEFGNSIILVTPGIRYGEADRQDQVQTMSPVQAAAAGADHVVVGRPITQAADPAAAASRILNELESVG